MYEKFTLLISEGAGAGLGGAGAGAYLGGAGGLYPGAGGEDAFSFVIPQNCIFILK